LPVSGIIDLMPNSLLEMKRKYSPIKSFECNRCGEPAEHRHHIDRDRSNNEDKNIELLCGPCHAEEHGRAKHGSLTMYSQFKCRCSKCRKVWNAYYKVYKRKQRAKLERERQAAFMKRRNKALALRLQGYSYTDIAAELGISYKQAYEAING
jgi:hypothetical protein